MIYGVFAVKDCKTGFMTPTVDYNNESAARNFVHALISTKGLFYTHPADFELYRLGEFNTENGKIAAYGPELVLTGIDAKERIDEV